MSKRIQAAAWAAAITAACLSVTGLARAETAGEPHAIVDAENGFLLGAAAGGRWLDAESAAPALTAGGTYRIYGLDGPAGEFPAGPAESYGDPCPDTLYVPLVEGGAGVALGGGGNAMPRMPALIDPSHRVYREAAAAWLRDQGLETPMAELQQIIRVDIEGDGVDEVLLSASYQAPRGEEAIPGAQAGDYSFVLLRRLRGDKVETLGLDSAVYADARPGDINYHHRVSAILDLNGDGIMEIVIVAGYYEGIGTGVFDLRSGKPELVLETGCGA